jgi:hypothetical protein
MTIPPMNSQRAMRTPFPSLPWRLQGAGLFCAGVLCCGLLCTTLAAQQLNPTQPAGGAENPYRLDPFEPGFPVELEYPPHSGLEYVRTRRQILERLAANLQGNVRRDTWQLATEFYWRAPEDAVEPLIEAMDRALGNPALGDVVKNCVEAMGRMADESFDQALRRALQHKNEAVRQAAYAALATSGKAETLRELQADFLFMNGRARGAWLRAVRERLPDDRVEILLPLMMAESAIFFPYCKPSLARYCCHRQCTVKW